MITIAYHDGTGETEKQDRWAERLSQRLGPVELVALSQLRRNRRILRWSGHRRPGVCASSAL